MRSDPLPLVLTDIGDGVGHAHAQQPRRAQHAHRADGRRDHRRDGRDRGRRGGRRGRRDRHAAGVLCRRQPRQPRRGDRRQPGHDLRGIPAHRPQPAADARRRQRRRGRRRHEPRARLRRAHRRRPGQARHAVPADRHPSRRRSHVDAAPHRRAAGGDGGRRVRPGARRRGGRTRSASPTGRCRRESLLEVAHEFAAQAASAPRELAIVTKQTIQRHGRHRQPSRCRRTANSSRSCGARSNRGSPSGWRRSSAHRRAAIDRRRHGEHGSAPPVGRSRTNRYTSAC